MPIVTATGDTTFPYQVMWSCGHWTRLNLICCTTKGSSYYELVPGIQTTPLHAHEELARRCPRCPCRSGT